MLPKLSISHTTLREQNKQESKFPRYIRESIISAISCITTDELQELLKRHESDAGNFDGTIETHLKRLLPDLTILPNHRISNETRFNNDLILEDDNHLVCIEIEKGYLSRFELDILKMQTFASCRRTEGDKKNIYGGFIVPSDNVVASHISGNSNESSYKYLCRLSRLVSQIESFPLQDILIVGYSTSVNNVVVSTSEPEKSPSHSQDNYVIPGNPLVDLNVITSKLSGYSFEQTSKLRQSLIAVFPGLREKFNYNSRYLGYGLNSKSDALYIYIQKKQLVLDIRVSCDEAESLRQQGFKVNPRDNYQNKAGWLTGVCIPHEQTNIDPIINLLKIALES